MNDREDLIRALAQRLTTIADFTEAIPDEASAARFFHRCAFHSCCPRCRAPCSLADARHAACPRCPRRVSLTAHSPLRNTKVSLRRWLAAIWHIHVDTQALPARAFARRYRLGKMTAWRLLHAARDALILFAPLARSAKRQVLGRQSATNAASACAAVEDGLLRVLSPEDVPEPVGALAPVSAVVLGQLEAWLGCVFRGVSRRHRERYFAEFADRYGRVSGRSLAWARPAFV